jgi:hypothetical protein
MVLPLLFSDLISAQIIPGKISTGNISSDLKHQGTVIKAFSWTDNNSVNYLLYCETDEQSSSTNPNEKSKELYVYYYRDGELVWKISDFVKNCEFDISTYFIEPALSITDLNKNGSNEIWVMYRLGCKSDVSAWPLKLIMYEGNEKFAIRGETRDYSESYTAEQDSPKKIDDNFKKGDERILGYALNLWKKNNIPNWE